MSANNQSESSATAPENVAESVANEVAANTAETIEAADEVTLDDATDAAPTETPVTATTEAETTATPSGDDTENLSANEISAAEDEPTFKVTDRRRFSAEEELYAEAVSSVSTADDQSNDDDDDNDDAYESDDEDAFEINLDEIKLDAEESEREVAALRAKLYDAERKAQTAKIELAEAVKAGEEFADRFRKAQAQLRLETDEMRTRLQRNFEQRLEVARGDVVAGLLDTLDNLQRAVGAANTVTDPQAAFDSLRDGVKATAEMFESQLKKLGLQVVISEGEPFNPEVHDAVEIAPVDKEQDNFVLAELQRGYKFNERLLRPARVKVGRSD